MFLKQLLRRNPEFLKASIQLHQAGKIPANSYMGKNAAVMAAEGKRLGLKVFPMTKQFGRNVKAMDVLALHGLDSYVAVDMGCSYPIHAAGYKIGHLGHLVQIPFAETRTAASFKPAYWTVYNEEKAAAASRAAGEAGYRQALLARLFAPGDIFYMGHEGGFRAEDVLRVADAFDRLEHACFAGITTFPALLYDGDSQAVKPTPNLKTLEAAAKALQDLQAEVGPYSKAMVAELPAALYLSEVSHIHNGSPFCFGGGMYIDPVFPDYDLRAIAGKDPEEALKHSISVKIPPPSAIDYYGIMQPSGNEHLEVGDTVVFGFRIQAFVTRAYVVPVSGISVGTPVVEGVFTSEGRKTNWPLW